MKKLHPFVLVFGLIAIPIQIFGMINEGLFSLWTFLFIIIIPGFVKTIIFYVSKKALTEGRMGINIKCAWMLEYDGNYYETSCDNLCGVLDDGNDPVNGFKFCPFCGKEIIIDY